MSPLELSSLIYYLSEKDEIFKGLNEKIIIQCYDIKTEIEESEKYSYDLNLRIQNQQAQNTTINSSVVCEEDLMVQRHAGSSTYIA